MTMSTDRLRREAKALARAVRAGEDEALARVRAVFPGAASVKHADALHVIARESGFASWPRLKLAGEISGMTREARAERLKVALYFGQDHVVRALLGAEPGLARANLGLRIALYDLDGVKAELAGDPEVASRVIGVRAPILHLAFSRHWRALPEGGARSVAMAELLVAHGADVNASYPAEPGSEHRLSALYGALGHAGNMDLARWLLEHGADPNDNESLYHATELGHAGGLRLLLKHGARSEGTNALLRAMDFNDLEMVRLLLEAGADPNEGVAEHPSGQPPVLIPGLHQAARRMCSADIAEALIAHGGDGRASYQGHSAYAIACMRGNRAVAAVLRSHGQATELSEIEKLLARAAEGPVAGRIDPGALSAEQRLLIHRMLGFDGTLDHIKRLVALGYDPDWCDEQQMPAIHIAAWEGLSDAVRWLLTLGPDLEHKNMYGGDLMGTVIHGAEFCPARAARDHLGAARAILDAGARLHLHDVTHCGVEAMSEMLADWAAEHPDRVVRDA